MVRCTTQFGNIGSVYMKEMDGGATKGNGIRKIGGIYKAKGIERRRTIVRKLI